MSEPTFLKYPRTPHLTGSRLQAGDEGLALVALSALAGRHLVVEEKLDGANSAISFGREGGPLLQSRGHYLRGGGAERQFDLFKTWAQAYAGPLREILGTRYVMYGEWLYAKHTVFYDDLPHYFLEFDVYDREREVFLASAERAALRAGLPLAGVPILAEGLAEELPSLPSLVARSRYKSAAWLSQLDAAAKNLHQPTDLVRRQTDPSSLAEGLYVKWEQAGVVRGRFKLVRATFLDQVAASGSHWADRPILPNRLRAGVELFPMSEPERPLPSPALLKFSGCAPRGPDFVPDLEALWQRSPWLGDLDDCPQDPVYHAEGSVGVHTRLVVDVLCREPDWRALPALAREELYATALLHDVGKPITTRPEGDGRYSSRGHARVGARLARRLLWTAGVPIASRERICALIEQHLVPFRTSDLKDPPRELRRIALGADLTSLVLQARADALGRTSSLSGELLASLELFAELAHELEPQADAPFPSDWSRFRYFRDADRHPGVEVYDDSRLEVVVLSGIPAAGKSTWVAASPVTREPGDPRARLPASLVTREPGYPRAWLPASLPDQAIDGPLVDFVQAQAPNHFDLLSLAYPSLELNLLRLPRDRHGALEEFERDRAPTARGWRVLPKLGHGPAEEHDVLVLESRDLFLAPLLEVDVGPVRAAQVLDLGCPALGEELRVIAGDPRVGQSNLAGLVLANLGAVREGVGVPRVLAANDLNGRHDFS